MISCMAISTSGCLPGPGKLPCGARQRPVAPTTASCFGPGRTIVGVYLAFYSDREIDGRTLKICNLAAWCVVEQHRSQGLRLVRAMLGQRGYEFTDLSPSGNVVALNRRLKFRDLDTATDLVVNLPWPVWSRRTRIVSDLQRIEELLQGRELKIYRDHQRSAAARHFVIVRDDQLCYVMFRRDRRKKLPLFASLLYVSSPEVFRASARMVEATFAAAAQGACHIGRAPAGRIEPQAGIRTSLSAAKDVQKQHAAAGAG